MAQAATTKFTLSRSLQDGMSLRFRDNEYSGGFSVRWTNLTANVYLDATNQTVRVIGYASGTHDAQQISYTTTRAVAQPLPNPPIQVTGTVTVRLALPTGGLFFDTGYRPLSWDQSSGQYTFDGSALGTIPVVGSFTLVTGGKTYATNFSYALNAALGGAFTFTRLSTTNYPQSLVMSAFGWTGGMFSYSVGVDTAAQVTADNGFPVTIKPGMQMWGLFNGESFNWSFGAQQNLPGGAGVDYTPTSAYPGEAPLLPTITTQPASTTANVGGNVSFSVTATGKAPLTYRWLFNGSAIVDGGAVSGSTNNLLTLGNVATNQSGNYSVIVANGYGGITSSVATLIVSPLPVVPPSITQQPQSQSVNQGSPVSFSVVATGTGLGFQWRLNSGNISGATNASYSLASTTTNDAGTYAVIVSNAGGCVTSSNAVLTVNSTSPPPGFLTNGLVAYYPFNGNANDESGSGNNLSATNVQFLTVNPWIMNPVAALENPVSYMLGQHSLLNGVTNWTWSAWANPTSYTNGLQILFCEANSTAAQTGGSVIVIGLNSRAKLFAVSSWNVGNLPDFWKGAQFPITVSSGFHHFALTLQNGGIDAGTLSLFVDGLLAGSAGHQSVAAIPGAPMTVALGEDPSFPLSGRSSAYQYKGEMDSVRIYNRALSTSEVQQLYAYESPASSPPIIASQPVSQSAHQGSSASFNVAATGINLRYQWHLNSVNIPGATNASYSLASATANNAGTYAVIVSNAGGSVTSSNAVLTVIPPFSTATGTATLFGIFVVGANITDGGSGYTNTPIVRFVGGGGSGAQAVAVVSNGMVTAISMLDAGYGYTNAPLFVIDPPFIAHPVLGIAPMSFLSFTNLTVGGSYQLQRSMGWYWADEPVSFTATGGSYTQMVAGVAVSGDYRLALNPVPAQAFATAQLFNGFVVGAAVTSGGSGYVTSPVVNIVGGGGTNATAVSHMSGGVVTAVSITDAGIGYTNAPTIQIAAPPAAAVSPTVRPVMRVDAGSLAPYSNYQIQFKLDLGEAWGNWNGGLFTPTDGMNSQYLFITNGAGFFRLQHAP